MMSSGNEGCKCINQTSLLASLQNRDCTTSTGQPGVYLALGGSCVSYDYGSNGCLQHDLLHDPICQGDPSSTAVPPWCFQTWCYVDASLCKKNSEEDIYQSDYFDPLFYSYSTCNSTDYFWRQQLESTATNVSIVGGIGLTSTVPYYQYPMLSKLSPDGKQLLRSDDRGEEYFDDSIPFRGVYIDYVNSLVKISNGDILHVNYTHTSRASLKRYYHFTAAVHDVENGLVDMAVGPYWITAERLKMTAFTVPVVYDKTVLVIPTPGQKSSLAYETRKVLEPFTYGLWGVLLTIIFISALLSVWFSDREMIAKRDYGVSLKQQKKSGKKRKRTYFRLILDAFLEKGMFFFSAGIEQDVGASLPHKVLMFGFGFFILIAVSAYVANLAAFLTQSGLEANVGTLKEVIDRNIAICGHPALEEELRLEWPDGKWLFPHDGFIGPNGMFEAYEKGDCQVLAVGREDTIMDKDVLAKMCKNKLVYTENVIHENPIAFPIRPQLATAFSYWMYTSEKLHGITLESAKKEFIEKNEIMEQCEVELSNLSLKEVNDFARVSTKNMFFPIMAFVTCAVVAVTLQLIHDMKRKQGQTSDLGRKSTLEIFQSAMNDLRRFSISGQEDGRMVVQKKDCSSDTNVGGDGVVAKSDGDEHEADKAANILGDDEFSENDAPQIIHRSSSTVGAGLRKEEISHRIDELVESGVIDEVLDCFDFFQEIKKLKKDQ